jgi:hypothetical protein
MALTSEPDAKLVGAEFLFQVIAERAEKAAVIVTTNLVYCRRNLQRRKELGASARTNLRLAGKSALTNFRETELLQYLQSVASQ